METEESAIEKDYFLEGLFIIGKTPVLEVDNEEQKSFLSGLWYNLLQWHALGSQRVLYRELAGSSPNGIAAIKDLLGKENWAALYGKRQVTVEDVVPGQLKHNLKEVLDKLASKMQGDAKAQEAAKAKAKAVFAGIQAQEVVKRRRVVEQN